MGWFVCDPDNTPISESAVLDAITEGEHELVHLCFVYRNGILRWNPDTGTVFALMSDEAALANACRRYLRNRGQAFQDPEELEAWVRAQNWPFVDRLLPSIEYWKKRK